jgi:hypothetical protein
MLSDGRTVQLHGTVSINVIDIILTSDSIPTVRFKGISAVPLKILVLWDVRLSLTK